jgi:hypothetical protein
VSEWRREWERDPRVIATALDELAKQADEMKK